VQSISWVAMVRLELGYICENEQRDNAYWDRMISVHNRMYIIIIECSYPQQAYKHMLKMSIEYSHVHVDSASLLSTWSWLNLTNASYCSAIK